MMDMGPSSNDDPECEKTEEEDNVSQEDSMKETETSYEDEAYVESEYESTSDDEEYLADDDYREDELMESAYRKKNIGKGNKYFPISKNPTNEYSMFSSTHNTVIYPNIMPITNTGAYNNGDVSHNHDIATTDSPHTASTGNTALNGRPIYGMGYSTHGFVPTGPVLHRITNTQQNHTSIGRFPRMPLQQGRPMFPMNRMNPFYPYASPYYVHSVAYSQRQGQKSSRGVEDTIKINRPKRSVKAVDYSMFDSDFEENENEESVAYRKRKQRFTSEDIVSRESGVKTPPSRDEDEWKDEKHLYVEKILYIKEMTLEEALRYNIKTLPVNDIYEQDALSQSDTKSYLDGKLNDIPIELLRVVPPNMVFLTNLLGKDRSSKHQFYLVKVFNKSYIHIEFVLRELILSENGGAVKLKRFAGRKEVPEEEGFDVSLEDFPKSASFLFDPSYLVIDRIIHVHKDDSVTHQKSDTAHYSYYVKWCGISLMGCTWEYEEDLLKNCTEAPSIIQKYKELSKPSVEKLASVRTNSMVYDGGTDVIGSDRQGFQKFEESPVFKDGNVLRKYQLEGLNWLSYCYYNRTSCIIADEMGLGKTIQAAAFLEYLFTRSKAYVGPFIVVVPLSTIVHWQREIEKWTRLNVLVYHGRQEEREIMFDYEFFYRDDEGHIIPSVYKFDLLLTTYEVIISGTGHLSDIIWRVAVFDEAHRLKNATSKCVSILKNNYKFMFKILLSGTPLQNSLEELWSLLNFLNPFKFPTYNDFLISIGLKPQNSIVNSGNPINQLASIENIQKCQDLLAPLMLRRLKEDVEKSIPIKEETIVEIELTLAQKKYYRAILEKNFQHLIKGIKGTNVPNLINIMMELRKCCIHPYLIKGAEQQILQENDVSETDYVSQCELMIASSGKLVLLDKLLKKLREGNHRVLIFSQMTRCLDILNDYLIYRGYPFERIDGSIKGKDRQISIDRFNSNIPPPKDIYRSNLISDSDVISYDSDTAFIFLLCTRAGGVGINLTSADTVIIFDSDWNPQNDIQAQARCHRIGQTSLVKVYRLLTVRTYEKDMFDKAAMKLGLEKAILQRMNMQNGDESATPDLSTSGDRLSKMNITKNEIELLLKKGAYGSLLENDEDAIKFCEEDIDQILERRTTVIKHEYASEPQNRSLFSKASFTGLSGDKFDIDLNDPDFWNRWLDRCKETESQRSKKNEPQISKEKVRNNRTEKMKAKETKADPVRKSRRCISRPVILENDEDQDESQIPIYSDSEEQARANPKPLNKPKPTKTKKSIPKKKPRTGKKNT